ncbi:MAG: carbohydrate kinase family protein [Tepidiformaceae bacterium]
MTPNSGPTASAKAKTAKSSSARGSNAQEDATHIVIAGNVVEDRTAEGGLAPGGPALYAARMAAALGARVTLLSGPVEARCRPALEGISLTEVPRRGRRAMPLYVNSYAAGGARSQQLLADGGRIAIGAGLARAAETPIDVLLYAPAYHELSRPALAARARLTGTSLQGLLRVRGRENSVVAHPAPWLQARPFVFASGFVFLSEEDTPDAPRLARAAAAEGAVAFVTRAASGAVRYSRTESQTLDALPASPVDPTGAGDCFAAAFMVRMAETGDVDEATSFALAAGALATEGHGLAAVPGRAAIEARVAKAAR